MSTPSFYHIPTLSTTTHVGLRQWSNSLASWDLGLAYKKQGDLESTP
ncbi:MAG: hypothetical protein JW850_14280 [Thermoflexales bacterium]|nr:hypothetical protein [Thermoflexales bacterium]